MGAIQDIFRIHGPAYLEKFGDRMPEVHRKATEAIISCRSPVQGFTVGRRTHRHQQCQQKTPQPFYAAPVHSAST